ncbi:phosphatidylglycerophosphatase A, partial [Wenyingzhuangia sp. 1_MG-2023]|nr:phosphatidylglycerophosphatase A [Wenyingzhuangia sp. 1_MG-2023]
VWDDWIGLWFTFIALPSGWEWILAGFVLFRFFDILKPWPIKWLEEQVEGGFGIMIDDVLAGIFALVCLQLAAWVLI